MSDHPRPASFGTEPSPRFRIELRRDSPHDGRVTGVSVFVGDGPEPLQFYIRSLSDLNTLLDGLEIAEQEWTGESYCACRAEDRAKRRSA